MFAVALCPAIFTATPYPPAEPASLTLDPAVRQHLSQFKDVHPRLYLAADDWPAWRQRIQTSHRGLWEKFASGLERLKTSQPPTLRWDRGDGNRLAVLAFAWAMTEDPQLLETAKNHLLALAKLDIWDPNTDLLHGHLLCGAAVAYDWLYPQLSDEQRQLVRQQLGRQAQLQFHACTAERAWWRNQFLQNHGHVNLCGLAFAAAVLSGDDPRAEQWLALSDWFFQNTFEFANPDGSSLEGLSYGAYALEFCLRYAELARRLLGRDYYDSPWLKNGPDYLIHSTLPVMAVHNWAMTFGDSPRAAESHLPVHSMFRMASQYRDGRAQWIATKLADLVGLGPSPELCILWHDPTVQPVPRDQLPTLGHIADLGQVMMRSSWDSDAVLVGLHCGPWMGHRLDEPALPDPVPPPASTSNPTSAVLTMPSDVHSGLVEGHKSPRKVTRDLGAAHAHPDINSFQIYGYGQWLAIDPLYTHLKRTANHNTVLVNGFGQLGEGREWFCAEEAHAGGHTAKIVKAVSAEAYDYVVGDATGAYHDGLGLARFVRHMLFLKPNVIVLVDDLAAKPGGVLYSWRWDELVLKNMAVSERPWPCAMPTGTKPEAGVVFAGESGAYNIDFSYYDNSPRAGRYEVVVGDEVVRQWVNEKDETDLHTAVFEGVQLNRGEWVGVRGNPVGPDAKFLRLLIYDPQQPREARFDWLLHAEPEATMERVGQRLVKIRNADARLDVHLLNPEPAEVEVGPWEVLQGSSFKQTRRLRVQPGLSNGAAVVVMVLYVGRGEAEGLKDLTCKAAGREVVAGFGQDGRDVRVRMWLDEQRVAVERGER